jgi:hypothetical protein
MSFGEVNKNPPPPDVNACSKMKNDPTIEESQLYQFQEHHNNNPIQDTLDEMPFEFK